MGSVNFNPFNNNWFNKPSTPFQPINLLTHFNSLKPQQHSPPFAAISNPFSRKHKKTAPEQPGHYRRMLDQFYWECETRPDLRHAPKVEKILNEDPIFEKKENPTQEEIEENDKWWAEFKESPVVQFLAQAEEIADKLNELELKENSAPFRSEDKKLWQVLGKNFFLLFSSKIARFFLCML